LPDPTPDAPGAPFRAERNAMLGIGLKVASVCCFLAMSTLVKGTEGIPPGELVFFRSLFAVVPIVIFLVWRGEFVAAMKTSRPLGHLYRGLIGVCGMGSGFLALTLLPLPEAVAIGYGLPLLLVVFGAIFLKETVRFYRWSAVVVGIIGVAIITWPRLSVFSLDGGAIGGTTLGAIAAICGCVFGAFAVMQVRNLVATERSATIVFYFSLTCSAVALLTFPFGWVMPDPQTFMVLVLAGILGGIGQILLTECFRHADVSVVAPFEYTSLILSIIAGYLFFADIPTVSTLIGAVIVVAAGLFIIWREHRLGLERKRARDVIPPQ
jgi:drug/metabolite transporter (DMT)-like permease